jgi:hypothetical protein
LQYETDEVMKLGRIKSLQYKMNELSVAGRVLGEEVVEVRKQPAQQAWVVLRTNGEVPHNKATQVLLT